MTHGEEPGPETHKDSAVLTYLEGLLMHPVVAGPGATASRRSEAAHSNQDQGDKAGATFQLPTLGPTAPKVGSNGPASQHLKKARLLRSGAWNDPGNQRLSSPPVELNGQAVGLQNGSREGSPQGGESTLLASLLQSFSSRLQNVAMSQHSNKPPSECSSPCGAPPPDKEPPPVYGTASSRLKGLMRTSKLQNHSKTPYSRRGNSHDRPPESPRAAHSATPPSATTASESVSCAERLKAVANMVKIRSSPAPSPKPSVACSQLALLLSSEAHLQQYSREHALKAQLSGRSASERLAAMANQQHGLEKIPGNMPGTSETLSSTNVIPTSNTVSRTTVSSPRSPALLCDHTRNSSPTPPRNLSNIPGQSTREKRSFDSRPTRPPQTCSSLLLLLLNNHNNQKQLTKNGHLEDGYGVLPPSGSSSVTSDSESSTHEKTLTKDSSDAESSYSSCSPMDLSMRNRANKQDKGQSLPIPCSSSASFSSSNATTYGDTTFSPPPILASSASSSSVSTSPLEKLTESLIKKWKPDTSGINTTKIKDHEMNSDLKSKSKVTLMQLLLERRNNDIANKATDKELPLDITMATMSQSQPKGLVPWEESRTKSPIEKPIVPAPPPPFALSRSGALSPYPPSPQVQSGPLDLCKSKVLPAEKAKEPAFSASKLLQNLAQSGIASSSPPIPCGKALGPDLDTGRPLSSLERLNAPVNRTTPVPLPEGTPLNRHETFPPSSQIENLLERRTVLQLLLGSGSNTSSVHRKDIPVGISRSADSEGVTNDSSPGISNIRDSSPVPTVNVRVKTEEVAPSPAEIFIGRKRRSSFEKQTPPPDDQADLKAKHRPVEVIAKYGLLSQLLKQQTATYYSSAVVQTESQPRSVKEETKDYPSPSPKKRHLGSEPTDASTNTGSPRTFERGNTMFASFGGQDEPEKPRNLKEEDLPTRSPPAEPFPRESRGFNVLKQLLLSDNCLKELSQESRGGPSILQTNGRANGSLIGQPAQNHNFLHLPSWHPHASVNSGLPSHVRTLSAPPPVGDGPRGHHPTQKRDPPHLVKQEPESPVRWSSQGNDEDSNPDSPRLSRSNPILYYMLQKGSVQLRKESKDQAHGTRTTVHVKEEPVGDVHVYEQSLSSTPQSPTHRHDKHSQEKRSLSHE
uniref:nuclear receptor-interacting protein 1 n=1 Tax=Doryrhamphus excisus TaxID=161450 RepID=UPI0025AE3627|nr:nuclear receptor-interacting protein 1 [Doryrhamphus excisus]XP_057944266.1 nuclear receptor-interacting protein 1 [Doryrhamphus excisus]XP_057944267.1 nuclear receptor-interacting protein 1 [Doryrhamphus excisus]XP_057944268.1 nuclear receptor-interacting protein 1 [Doryrhamphus excisus]